MKNKYDFYEIVIINTDFYQSEIRNKRAVITGMSEEEGVWYYGLCVYLNENDSDGWTINEKYLQPTGKFMKREDFYDGSTAKVVVDEQGRGHLKELHLKEDKPDKNV